MIKERIRRALLDFLFPPVIIRYRLGLGADTPYRKYEGDAGWDLYTAKETIIPAHAFTDVSTELYLDMPDGVWCRITGRSSTVRKWGVESIYGGSRLGLEVIEGVIDTGYTGELFIGVINHSDKPIQICQGDRLAQAIFSRHVDVVQWKRSQVKFKPKDRGSLGFGSTGRNEHEQTTRS